MLLQLPAPDCPHLHRCLALPCFRQHASWAACPRLLRRGLQDSPLFNWLVALYPAWATMTGADAYISAKLAMAELLLSGCTCTSG